MNKDQEETYLRELALVDRIIGLEAEVARLSIDSTLKDLRILHKSRAWRFGHAILSPLSKVKQRVFNR